MSKERQRKNYRKYYEANKEAILARRRELYAKKPKRTRDHVVEAARVTEKRNTKDGWIKLALTHARHRAKKKGIAFCLDFEDIHVPEFCPVLGIKLEVATGPNNPRRNYASPTLDRVKNDMGYVRGNVRVISARANSLKSNASIEEMEAVLDYMKEDKAQDETPKVIHINRHHLAANTKDGGNRPIISVKHKNTTRYAREVSIDGPCHLRYDGTALACGARTWIETTSPISLVDEMTFNEARTSL